MEADLLSLFEQNKDFAFFISILVNIIIAILGVIPSFFITGANIMFFGFWEGITISFLGETLGAIIAFSLYRKGLKRFVNSGIEKYPKLEKLLDLEGRKAFYTVLSLRLMPFMPSGLVTATASVSKISLALFAISSSLGKIPALLIEGLTVYQVISASWQSKILLLLLGLLIFVWNIRKSR